MYTKNDRHERRLSSRFQVPPISGVPAQEAGAPE